MEDRDTICERLREQASLNLIAVTLHAQQEMVDDNVRYEDAREALRNCRLLENYPNHRRGPCCLVVGQDAAGRFLHLVCTTSLEKVVLITVYEPTPPKWPTPFSRRQEDEMQY